MALGARTRCLLVGLVCRRGGVPTPQSWSNPTDEFRYGRGSVTPVPLGGTGLASDSAGRTKAPQEALTGRDDFAHGSGSTVPKPLGGP